VVVVVVVMGESVPLHMTSAALSENNANARPCLTETSNGRERRHEDRSTIDRKVMRLNKSTAR